MPEVASAIGSPRLTAGFPLAPMSASARDSPEKIRKAASDFEALLIEQMLKSARESGGGVTGDEDEQDETNSTVLELGEQQLAQVLAKNGGFGIAKMVIAGLNNANR
jgi:peptidoglycan hydrolase FlgJ